MKIKCVNLLLISLYHHYCYCLANCLKNVHLLSIPFAQQHAKLIVNDCLGYSYFNNFWRLHIFSSLLFKH